MIRRVVIGAVVEGGVRWWVLKRMLVQKWVGWGGREGWKSSREDGEQGRREGRCVTRSSLLASDEAESCTGDPAGKPRAARDA